MNHCPNCGEKINDTDIVCSGCGKMINRDNEKNARCSECGQLVDIKSKFCTNCGAKFDIVENPVARGSSTTSQGILEFVRKAFRTWYAAILWLDVIGIPITGFIVGGLSGAGYRESFNIGYAILGLIIGGILGIVSAILGGGLIASFLELCENARHIRESNVAIQKELEHLRKK